jgi:AcrR family transcriptional regulator
MKKKGMSKSARERRRYDSPLRRQRAAETRERIIASGAELLHGFPIWNWSALTVRAVAERARVNERTVYRHFSDERELRDAVLSRLEGEARVDIDGLELADLRDVTARIFEYVSSFPLEPRTPRDSTLTAAGRRNREALLAAVTKSARDWTEGDRVLAAATLDVLWSVASYERLVADWGLDPKQAIQAMTWVIGLIEAAIRRGHHPRE